MPMRWKLLILLLCISVGPILVLRTMSQQSSANLGRELAQQEEQTLIKRSETALRRLVEDHARLTGREKSLLEAMAALQANAVKEALSKAPTQDIETRFASRRQRRSDHVEGEGRATRPQLETVPGMIFAAPKVYPAEFKTQAAQLAGAQDKFLALARRHPDLMVRQITVLKSGLAAMIPGPKEVPARFNPAQTYWFKDAIKGNAPIWGAAHLDMIDSEPVMLLAMPFQDEDGQNAGVTVIVARVQALLQKDRPLPGNYGNIKRFLIRVQPGPSLEVVAKEQDLPRGRQWWLPENKEALKCPDSAKFRQMAKRLQNSESGVMEMKFEQTTSMWAFAPANWEDLALLIVVPREDLVAEAAAAREKVLQRIEDHIWSTRVLVVGVIALILIVALVSSRTVTLRLNKMVAAVRQLEKGNLSAEVDIRGRDEIGALGMAFNHMLPALRERLRLKESLDLAHEVQVSLLPKQDLDLPGLKVSGASRYCDETGGDFFDFIPLDGEEEARYVLLAGDVTGHGAQAALLMATVRAFLRAELCAGKELAPAITAANRLLCRDTFGSGRFVTLFALQIDSGQGLMSWVKAGQHPGLMILNGTPQIERLEGNGLPMGVDPDIDYASAQMPLPEACTVAISTDGLFEARNPKGAMFGLQGLEALMKKKPGAETGELLDMVFDHVERHQEGESQEDDFTLIVVRLQPDPKA